MRAYIYKTNHKLELKKIPIEFKDYDVESIHDSQQGLVYANPDGELMKSMAGVKLDAIRKDTNEKIKICLLDIFFEELNEA